MADRDAVLARLRESAAADAAREPLVPYRTDAYSCARCGATSPAVSVAGGLLAFCHCDFDSDPVEHPPFGARRRDRFYPSTLEEFPELAYRTAQQARALGWKRRPEPRWSRWRGLQLARSVRKRWAVHPQPHPRWRERDAQTAELEFGRQLAAAYLERWKGHPGAPPAPDAQTLLRQVAEELEKLGDGTADDWLERWRRPNG